MAVLSLLVPPPPPRMLTLPTVLPTPVLLAPDRLRLWGGSELRRPTGAVRRDNDRRGGGGAGEGALGLLHMRSMAPWTTTPDRKIVLCTASSRLIVWKVI